ncbi:uncharacterized protein LOC135366508 [Ornithodoros turicata]|uniref:uncharacterized protein LOC135366508 n=1 Tax=Ornithodoros turicata TaxID=34597 RepID=UPI00313A320F
MKFHLFISLAFLATAIAHCHCLDTEDDRPVNLADLEDEYIVETFKNISQTLKNRLTALVVRALQTTHELKKVAGDGGKHLKEHLKELWREIAESRDQLKEKLREAFVPAQYSFESRLLRRFKPVSAKLQRVLAQLREGSKLERIRGILSDIYEEIRGKLRFRKPRAAEYSEDVAPVETEYIIKTLKELRAAVKDKMGVLFDKIKAKAAEVRRSIGDRAKEVKAELKALREKLASTRDDVRDKVKEIFRPSQYTDAGFVGETLRPLHEKFEKFMRATKDMIEDDAEKAKELLQELESEIERVVNALGLSTYTAEQDATEDALAFEQLTIVLHNELLDIIAKLEGLQSDETPNQEAIEEQLRRLDELKKKVRAVRQQLQQPAKYFFKPVLERLNNIFDRSGARLLDFVEKVSKAARVVKHALGHVSKHVKHSFGKIKGIVAKGRDQVKQHVRDALGKRDDTTEADTYTTTTAATTDDVQEVYTTTDDVQEAHTTTDDVQEAHTTTDDVQEVPTTTDNVQEVYTTTDDVQEVYTTTTDTDADESRSTTSERYWTTAGFELDSATGYPSIGDPVDYEEP